MNRSIFGDIYYTVFKSGNRLYLFIGINVLVFLVINLIAVFEFLFTRSTQTADWIERAIAMPAYLPQLPYKFWTVITYMFGHRGLFHILFNMLWLYWLGRIFMDFLNKRQFTFTYLAGGISGAALFILFYNVFPAFSDRVESAYLIGASASVMAVVVATATLLPDYTISLLFFGSVRLKYIALVYVILDVIGIAGGNPGGNISHLGGALLGFIYIKQLQNGNDWSKIFSRFFKKKSKMKVVQKNRPVVHNTKFPDQDLIDTILDKISKSGYESLTKAEKEQLFNVSKKDD